MVELPARPDIPVPGVVGWLTVSADNPDTWVGRWRTGPLGLQIAPLRHGKAPFGFRGARLRGARSVWSASTISGAVLSRAAHAPGITGWENFTQLVARVSAPGPVFDAAADGVGTLRVYDAQDEIVEPFEGNTHLYTLNVPKSAVALEPGVLSRMRGTAYPLTSFQQQMLRSAVGLLQVGPDDLSTGSSLVGLDRYLAALAGLLLRVTDDREPRESQSVEGLRSRADAIIFERSTEAALTPSVVAEQLNVSLRHLYRAFDGIESPASRIRRRRLEHAAEILAGASGGAGQVERVATECGFASAEYFSRAFRKEFGMSPRAYRSSHRGR